MGGGKNEERLENIDRATRRSHREGTGLLVQTVAHNLMVAGLKSRVGRSVRTLEQGTLSAK